MESLLRKDKTGSFPNFSIAGELYGLVSQKKTSDQFAEQANTEIR